MISKKKAIIGSIVLVAVTAMLTSTLQIAIGNKVVIPRDLYESYKKYNKLIGLEQIVEGDFYKEVSEDDLVQGSIKGMFSGLGDIYSQYYTKEEFESLKEQTRVEGDFYKEVSEDDLVQGSIKGMFSGLGDIYSQYYTKEEFESLKEQTSGSFVGIGVYISPTSDDDYITIIAPIEGSPAEKGGIKSGDKIIKVDDQNVYANDSDKAISMIKGKAGTEVKLTLKRGEEELNLKIKREEIISKSVDSKFLEDGIGYIKITSFNENTYKEFTEALSNLKKENMKGLVLDLRNNPGGFLEDGIGYIKITSFNENTYKEFTEALSNLKKENMKGLVLDLRNNPGGLLDICSEIADDLIGEGTIVYTKDNKGDKEYIKSDSNKLGLPIAVLVNES